MTNICQQQPPQGTKMENSPNKTQSLAVVMGNPAIPTPSLFQADRPIRRRFAVDGRVRSGCLTCKARKKKCDGQASGLDNRCRSCVRLGLVCEQLPLRKVTPRLPRRGIREVDDATPSLRASEGDQDTTNTNSPTQNYHQIAGDLATGDSPKPAPSYLTISSASWDGIERILLKYFLDHVAPLCSILQQDGSIFCSVLLPMAIMDPPLLHALFAYASVHFDAADPAKSVTPEARLKFENQVARGMAEAITNNAVTETTVACALVISTTEVIAGDTSRWLLHLQGAGHLINHLGTQALLRTTDGAFLLRYFAYHDIMASLTTGRHTLVEGVYWGQDIDSFVDSADSFMGLAHHIFRHLTGICAFVVDTFDLSTSSCPNRRSIEILRAEDMAQALLSQDLQLQVDSTDPHVKALIHHAEAFRFATLFYLYRHILRFCDMQAVLKLRMQSYVDKILQHVSQVPSNMFCEMGLLFPLFMAGIGSVGNHNTTKYIEDRLDCIESWTKFKHIARARELLCKLWNEGRTDWEVKLEELGWHMSLA
ncbi:hypothetical protein ACHAPJ_010429 [Fusarium lateritium]